MVASKNIILSNRDITSNQLIFNQQYNKNICMHQKPQAYQQKIQPSYIIPKMTYLGELFPAMEGVSWYFIKSLIED